MAKYPRDKDFKIVRRGAKSYYTFELFGANDLVNDLGRMEADIRKQEGQFVIRKALEPVEARVRANVPVDTGLLRQSVRQTKARADARGIKGSVRVGFGYRKTRSGKPRAAYALQVEYGSQGRPERPFIRPAFDGHERSIAADAMKWLKLRIIRWRFHGTIGRR